MLQLGRAALLGSVYEAPFTQPDNNQAEARMPIINFIGHFLRIPHMPKT